MVKKKKQVEEEEELFEEPLLKKSLENSKLDEEFNGVDELIERLIKAADPKNMTAITCEVCHKRKEPKYFIPSKNRFFYQSRISICSSCLKDLIDFDNEEEFKYLCTLAFIPFIPDAYHKQKEKYGDDIESFLIKYCQLLNLGPYAKYRPWMLERFRNPSDIKKEHEQIAKLSAENLHIHEQGHLREKWGYDDLEGCIKMEKLYNDMVEEYGIESAGDKDYVKKICQASYLMDKSLIENDIDQFQKLSGVYDKLMKSTNFNRAAKVKEAEKPSEGVYNFGDFFSLIEGKKFIPKFYNEESRDIVDQTIENLKEYTRDLISGEEDLKKLIEKNLEIVNSKMKQDEVEDSELKSELKEQSKKVKKDEEDA